MYICINSSLYSLVNYFLKFLYCCYNIKRIAKYIYYFRQVMKQEISTKITVFILEQFDKDNCIRY